MKCRKCRKELLKTEQHQGYCWNCRTPTKYHKVSKRLIWSIDRLNKLDIESSNIDSLDILALIILGAYAFYYDNIYYKIKSVIK